MVETLHALGQRLKAEGLDENRNPFLDVLQPHRYGTLPAAREALRRIGRRIEAEGLPRQLTPLTIGFLGYGNVVQGAREILEACFPIAKISPDELLRLDPNTSNPRVLYAVEFREEHTVEPLDSSSSFSLEDYWRRPERYRARFSRFLHHLTVIVNGIYWDERYPVLVSAEDLRTLYRGPHPKLKVIGDISCDIEGSIAVTRKATSPDTPCFVYDVDRDIVVDGWYQGRGPTIMAVDNLPCEFPVEASTDFGEALMPFLPAVCRADFEAPIHRLNLPEPIRKALILHRGQLTAEYLYLAEKLEGQERVRQ